VPCTGVKSKNDAKYVINKALDPERVIEVFKSSGIHRPVHDIERISKMFSEANLVISAWDRVLSQNRYAKSRQCICRAKERINTDDFNSSQRIAG
jgi:hypothetical protein